MSPLRRLGRLLAAPFRRFPRAAIALVTSLAAIVVLVVGANAYVLISARGDATEDVAGVPRAQAAIVLGALVEPDGTMSSMLSDRVAGAAELWRAGKVERILVSGDHGEWVYDEPDTMRMALLDAGVPARVIFTDHAGFDTRATMVRAREVFGVDTAVVVTQRFHMARALFLADAAGIDATGLIADRRDYGSKGFQSDIRELGSRVKAVGEVALGSGVQLGPEIPITGDGRTSWGPSPPPGTPPAGAPRG